jgi:hypothetical protein
VKIRAKTPDALEDLRRVRDLDIFAPTARTRQEGDFEVQGLLTLSKIEELRREGYEVELVADAEGIAAARLKELRKKNPSSG